MGRPRRRLGPSCGGLRRQTAGRLHRDRFLSNLLELLTDFGGGKVIGRVAVDSPADRRDHGARLFVPVFREDVRDSPPRRPECPRMTEEALRDRLALDAFDVVDQNGDAVFLILGSANGKVNAETRLADALGDDETLGAQRLGELPGRHSRWALRRPHSSADPGSPP